MFTTFSLKYENYINIFRQIKSESPLPTDSYLLKIILKVVFRRKINDPGRKIFDEILTIMYNLEAD